MKLDHHEEVFRKTLQEHYVPVDTRKLWKQIEPFVESEKKKRRPLFFWLSSLSLVVVIAFTSFYFINKDENKSATTTIIGNTDRPEETSVATSTAKTNSSSTSTSKEISIAESNINSKTNTESSSEIPTQEAEELNTKTSASINLSPIAQNQVKQNAPKATAVSFNNKLNNNNHSTSVAAGVSQKTTTAKHTTKTTHSNPAAIRTELLDELLPPTPTQYSKGSTSSNSPVKVQKPIAALENDIQPLTQRHEAALTLPSLSPGILAIDQKAITATTLKPVNQKTPRWNVFVETGLGDFTDGLAVIDNADYGFETFALNDVSTGHRYRNSTVGIEYKLGRNFSVQTGLSYSKLIERTRLNNVVELSVRVNGEDDIYYANDLMENNILLATVESFQYINQPINMDLTRHLYDIPLLVGYHRQLNRFDIGILGGILFNIASNVSGVYLDSDNRLVFASQEKSSNSTVSLDDLDSGIKQLNYQGGLRLGYQLTPHTNLYLHGHARYLRDFPTSGNSGNENIIAKGVNLGLRVTI